MTLSQGIGVGFPSKDSLSNSRSPGSKYLGFVYNKNIIILFL